jgi:hypothetical protein
VQGWTIFEILRYMPEHNWSAYEEALKTNPVLAKMMISGVVYSLGDWIAQVQIKFHFHLPSYIIYTTIPAVLLPRYLILLLFLFVVLTVLRREAHLRVRPYPYVPLWPRRVHAPRIPFALLLPFLRGINPAFTFFAYFADFYTCLCYADQLMWQLR